MMEPRTTRQLNKLSDEELAALQAELHSDRDRVEIESRRVSDIRHERLLGIRKRDTTED
ncbi:hypothetical protein SEA_HOTOROBO_99 [Gordonia phage Hotorobo]|uniref:Uncharacterized protein n=1 Tax=Gordonia phage Hotorobo TaxID=1821554 RepID=A0A142K8F8_9CAUD|nr:hypothetical protein BJD64_gp034 [Gordonia phage Hotorobo]AMS02391.1 hypothetical protein SEA_HOTOROBO_99 [Gordonia phage Hotorobo]